LRDVARLLADELARHYGFACTLKHHRITGGAPARLALRPGDDERRTTNDQRQTTGRAGRAGVVGRSSFVVRCPEIRNHRVEALARSEGYWLEAGAGGVVIEAAGPVGV